MPSMLLRVVFMLYGFSTKRRVVGVIHKHTTLEKVKKIVYLWSDELFSSPKIRHSSTIYLLNRLAIAYQWFFLNKIEPDVQVMGSKCKKINFYAAYEINFTNFTLYEVNFTLPKKNKSEVMINTMQIGPYYV